MAPKFGLDDGSSSNFDATLVLATMLISQLHEGNPPEPPQATALGEAADGTGSQGQQERCGVNVSEHPSDHTRIWSELSGNCSKFQCRLYMCTCKSYILSLHEGSAARSGGGGGGGAEARQAPGERDLNANEQWEIQRISTMHISKDTSARENVAVNPSLYPNCYCLFQYVTLSGYVIFRFLVALISSDGTLHLFLSKYVWWAMSPVLQATS